MAQQQETPIHWDQHASRWNLTLIFGLVVAILGIITANLLLTPLGLLMGGYSWFTTPRQYLLFRDRMVVVYGMPRTRLIPFAEISHVEILALPFGERLRLRMLSGSRLMLMMRDPGAFRNHLEDALAQYHGEQSGGEFRMQRYGAVVDAPDAGEPDDSRADADPANAPPQGATPAPNADPERDTGAGRPAPYEPSPTSGSYTENPDPPSAADPPNAAPPTDAPRTSGSYTEPPSPDYSGEGRPSYGADVDVDSGGPGGSDERNRPPSPY